MSELEVVRRMKDRVLSKVTGEARTAVEIEINRVEKEVILREDVLHCTTCPLAESCTNKVPGIGPIDANIMMVGEAPGEQEDIHGIPFVGPAGGMFNAAIQAVGWTRDDLFITNVLKCRPPHNRTPNAQEIADCYPHLEKEIQVVQPKVIVCLGATAANTLIHRDFKITQENGHWFELPNGVRAIAIYHPSYLLRLGDGTQKQTEAKWEVFNALKKVKQYQDSGFRDILG